MTTPQPPAVQPVQVPSGVATVIRRALVGFSDAELARLRDLQRPERSAKQFGAARLAAQQNIDAADAALHWIQSAPAAPEAVPPAAMGALRILVAQGNRIAADAMQDLDDTIAIPEASWEAFSDALDAAVEALDAVPDAVLQPVGEYPPRSQR